MRQRLWLHNNKQSEEKIKSGLVSSEKIRVKFSFPVIQLFFFFLQKTELEQEFRSLSLTSARVVSFALPLSAAVS